MKRTCLGTIIGGSLTDGLMMHITDPSVMAEIKTGKFVSIVNNNHIFFALVTNLKLEVTNPEILQFPPQEDEFLLRSFVTAHGLRITALLRPLLMLNQDKKPIPVTTIPSHFCPVYTAQDDEVSAIFHAPDQQHSFIIGYPLDMETPVCINLHTFAQRNSGIFGKTGTGKTFLTRLVLAGMLDTTDIVHLIFDMHSEYGLQARSENKGLVKGLKTLFGNRIALFSLDPASTRRRGGNPDAILKISYNEINVEDIISLQDELHLHPTACEAAYLLAAKYHKQWLATLLDSNTQLKTLAQEIGAHPESLAALYRKLKVIEHYSCFTPDQENGSINDLIETIDHGTSIIIEFGMHNATFCYLLVANSITRRLHRVYIKKTEQFLGDPTHVPEPRKLMITIEEAHKFLNPATARQTIFGTIAREMRKYYVTLLIVDQRPSQIESEILSQIGTKLIAQLSDERDIASVITGTANAHELKIILASLSSNKQVLALGHAFAMPIMLQVRAYDETFYQTLTSHHQQIGLSETTKTNNRPITSVIDQLFPD
jgi:hypothetical protein